MSLAFSLVVLLVFAANLILGWRFGVLRRIVPFALFYVLAVLAYLGGSYIAGSFGHALGLDPLYWNGLTFGGLAALGAIIGELLGFLYRDQLRRVATFAADSLLGAVLGAMAALLECGTFILLALAIGSPTADAALLPPNRTDVSQAVHGSILAAPLSHADHFVGYVMRFAIPSHFAGHLAQIDV
ncbi:MAG TPA: CvpA family protein [Candidatus Micrarchaeia archaeon]|nr:CvpA family protein [Candidatus Micrarchaeia archaeon]